MSAYYDFVFLNECCYWCLLSVVDSSLAVVCAFWRWFASVVFLFYFVLFRFSGDRSSQGKEIKEEWRGCRGGGGLLRGGSSSFDWYILAAFFPPSFIRLPHLCNKMIADSSSPNHHLL